MKVTFSKYAIQDINGVALFVERRNTKGAGSRWKKKMGRSIKNVFYNNVPAKLCNQNYFVKHSLYCLFLDNFLIAYSIHEDFVLIEAVLHESRVLK